jgi:hypothetical protein
MLGHGTECFPQSTVLYLTAHFFQILVKAQDSKRETCVTCFLLPRFVSVFKLNYKNDKRDREKENRSTLCDW